MLTGTRQFDAVEAQIQCLPLLHEELKTVDLEAWDRITPQGEPTGSYTKILQGNGTPLQCSCLENPRDRGAWWAAVYGVTQSRTRLKRLSSSSSNETC